MQGHDPAENGFAFVSSSAVFSHNARPDLNFLAEAKNARENGAAGDATLQFVDFCAGFIHIEGPDDDESRIRGEVSHGDWDTFHDVLVDSIYIVFQLCGYRDDGGGVGNGSW